MGNDIVISPMSNWTNRYRKDIEALKGLLVYNDLSVFYIPTSRFFAGINSNRSLVFKTKDGTTPPSYINLSYNGSQTVNKYSALIATAIDARELKLFSEDFSYEINKQVESALSDSVSNLKRRLQQAHGGLLSNRAIAATTNLSPPSNP
jgi:hypothetical protein